MRRRRRPRRALSANDDRLPPEAVRARAGAADTAGMDTTTPYAAWRCTLCSFEYDEARGLPDEGFAPGTRWSDIPEHWSCPDCGYAKPDFQMAQVALA